ncbi:MAG: NAD+ synthase [bacterium]
MKNSSTLRIALAQINVTVGDFDNNYKKIATYIKRAAKLGCHIVVFPELSLCGYPPEDLIYKNSFLTLNHDYIKKIESLTENIIAVVGFVNSEKDIYNSAAVICNNKILGIYNKIFLPNYGVFDEERYFAKGTTPLIFNTKDEISFSVSICEDIWYPEGPGFQSALNGADVVININASPFHYKKWQLREKLLSIRAQDYNAAIAYCNLVGGQDEIVFDGHSLIVDENGDIVARGRYFEEDLVIHDLNINSIKTKRLHDPRWKKKENFPPIFQTKQFFADFCFWKNKPLKNETVIEPPDLDEEVFKALVLGLRDYCLKNNFSKGVIGLSGGVDSSLAAVIAVEALGRENVTGLFMPSPYTSKESKKDAYDLAKNLGIKLLEIPITNIFKTYLQELKPVFNNLPANATEENLQARIRGNLLMALSNKFGWLVITTGNKSEMSTGYATLYGDMAGGFALLKDVSKTMVYSLCRYYNKFKKKDVIPQNVLTKAPTAELKPNQKDQDTLPPYDILDKIIKAYVEDDLSFSDIVSLGIDEETVKKVIKMIDANEYKRRQAPPGVKITQRAFGKDRRMPITNHFKEF